MILGSRVVVSSSPSDPRTLTTRHPNGTHLSLCPSPFPSDRALPFPSADCDMANDVLQALHPGPPAKPSLVKPDGLVGLCREHIRIALNSESRALPHTINSYIMTLRSKSVFVWYGLNNGMSPLRWKHRWTCTADSSLSSSFSSTALTSKHYFDYVNIELNGPNGSAGEARIQNTIANYISLRIPFHLANLARHASPNEFRPPTDAMRRVYGLQTGMGGGVWKVVVMEARGAEKSKEAGEEVEAEASALRNCNAQQLGQAGREDYEHMIYVSLCPRLSHEVLFMLLYICSRADFSGSRLTSCTVTTNSPNALPRSSRTFSSDLILSSHLA